VPFLRLRDRARRVDVLRRASSCSIFPSCARPADASLAVIAPDQVWGIRLRRPRGADRQTLLQKFPGFGKPRALHGSRRRRSGL
jgi:hypothetical protein